MDTPTNTRENLHDILDNFDTAMMIVRAGDSHMHGRPMAIARLHENAEIYFFTRIDSPGNFNDVEDIPKDRRAPLSRRPPLWVPDSEVRGEGIFIQFKEGPVAAWCAQQAASERTLPRHPQRLG